MNIDVRRWAHARAGWSGVLATAIALEVAATHNFIGHSWWTWRDGRPRGARGLP